MSKKWEYTPDELKELSGKAELTKKQKKNVMAQLLSDALKGATKTLLFFETISECKLTKAYLESLGYEVRFYNPLEEKSLKVSWKEIK